jgi:hypothetical protein
MMSELDELTDTANWGFEFSKDPEYLLELTPGMVRDAAAELARLRAIEAAAKELLATFEQYQPAGNHFAEFWWRVKPTAAMFARDEALDALAATLKEGNK